MAFATLISKLFGLVHQQAIATAFGVGEVVNAYNYAYVIPGFLLVWLGGINGSFHSTIASVLSRRKKAEAAPVVETITILVSGALLLVTVGLILFAEPLIDLVAPGLSQNSYGLEVREIAGQQFRIMAPMALLAGLIGIGFGALNAAHQYWLPSLSPLFSSVTVPLGLEVLTLFPGSKVTNSQSALLGRLVLAYATLASALLQGIVQIPTQWQAGYVMITW